MMADDSSGSRRTSRASGSRHPPQNQFDMSGESGVTSSPEEEAEIEREEVGAGCVSRFYYFHLLVNN